jgi:hypothetical protein
MKLELHGGRFKKKSKMLFKCFKKIKKIIDVDNLEI